MDCHSVTNCLLQNIDKELVIALMGVGLSDIQKTFDTVENDIMLAKLKRVCIEHKWFSCYLTGRSQSVSLDGHLSDLLPVKVGVLALRPTEHCSCFT